MSQPSKTSPLAFYFRKQLNTIISALGGKVKLTGFKYCPCCDYLSLIFWNKNYERKLRNLCKKWGVGDKFTKKMVKRENDFCAHCGSSFRIRTHAKTILKTLKLSQLSSLISFLKENPSFKVYEATNYWVFRNREVKKLENFVVSEFHPEYPLGQTVKGVRNENLEKLTFNKQSFDLVITGEVLEHVINLSKSLSEIHRVLKPRGYHIFTIPVNCSIKKTRLRAIVEKDGRTKHLLPPVLHGDNLTRGILAYRDFGSDIDKIFKRHGFEFKEDKYYLNGKHITSVYISQKI